MHHQDRQLPTAFAAAECELHSNSLPACPTAAAACLLEKPPALTSSNTKPENSSTVLLRLLACKHVKHMVICDDWIRELAALVVAADCSNARQSTNHAGPLVQQHVQRGEQLIISLQLADQEVHCTAGGKARWVDHTCMYSRMQVEACSRLLLNREVDPAKTTGHCSTAPNPSKAWQCCFKSKSRSILWVKIDKDPPLGMSASLVPLPCSAESRRLKMCAKPQDMKISQTQHPSREQHLPPGL